MKKKDFFLVGFAAGLAAVVALFYLFKHRESEEKPSKKAPQVPIKNPGEQSEFTTSASESEIG